MTNIPVTPAASTGEAHTYERRCDVCSQVKELHVRASSCGPISFAYCVECLQKGAEPYGALAAYLSQVVDKGSDLEPDKNMIHPGYQQLIDVTLEVVGKTREEFYAAVDKDIQDYIDFMNNLDEESVE